MNKIAEALVANNVVLTKLLDINEFKDENYSVNEKFSIDIMGAEYDFIVTTDNISSIEITYSCKSTLSSRNYVTFRLPPSSAEDGLKLYWNNGNDHLLGENQDHISNLKKHIEFLTLMSDFIDSVLSNKEILNSFIANDKAVREFFIKSRQDEESEFKAECAKNLAEFNKNHKFIHDSEAKARAKIKSVKYQILNGEIARYDFNYINPVNPDLNQTQALSLYYSQYTDKFSVTEQGKPRNVLEESKVIKHIVKWILSEYNSK